MSQPSSGGRFPDRFLFGAATSAFQIEGSPLADGAGPSNWYEFGHAGRLRDGETGDVACDHYRRYREDVALMLDLGLDAYRFSIAWNRILPAGIGTVNARGLDFYQRLVDLLLKGGIQPCVTLHHWDLPAALADRGGWLNPESASWFADYAQVVFRALGDRVPLWATINEPWVITHNGYVLGIHPPGRPDVSSAPLVAHHLLRAHGTAVQVYRAEARAGRGQIGLVVNLEPKVPASDSPADLAATARADAYMNRWYLDPVFRGHYPEEMTAIFGSAWPHFPEADFALIKEPIDFLGINYYSRGVTRNDDAALPVRASTVVQPASQYTAMDWEVWPAALTGVLRWVKERYGDVPLYVTENGAAFADPPSAIAGHVDDPLRVDYLRSHLQAAHDAIAAGVDLRGYFAWSLLDNVEWAEGTSKRFGLVHVNFMNQIRTPKGSARFYREVIRTRGDALGE